MFRGAFGLGRAEGMNEVAAMGFAGAAEARKCLRFGGGSLSPTGAEVEALVAARG